MQGGFLKEEMADDPNIGPEAFDLMLKLTQMDEEMRLGGGAPGTPQHIENLKNHAWF